MNKSKIALLVVAALVFMAVGFLVGQTVQAVKNWPGSDSDPVVTQSYVEQIVDGRVATLKTQIEELQAEVAELKGGGAATTTTGNTTGTTGTATETKVKITGNSVNVRLTPSTSAEKVGSVKSGDIFVLQAEQDGWYKIKLENGTLGWVSAQYASKQ